MFSITEVKILRLREQGANIFCVNLRLRKFFCNFSCLIVNHMRFLGSLQLILWSCLQPFNASHHYSYRFTRSAAKNTWPLDFDGNGLFLFSYMNFDIFAYVFNYWIQILKVLFLFNAIIIVFFSPRVPQDTNQFTEDAVFLSGGSVFLFDRKVLRYFRKDGHNWRKKKDGKTVKEAHEKLKVTMKYRNLNQNLISSMNYQ